MSARPEFPPPIRLPGEPLVPPDPMAIHHPPDVPSAVDEDTEAA